MSTTLRWSLSLLLLLAGVAVGVAVQHFGLLWTGAGNEAVTTDKKIAFYRHPMNPAITADAPRKDDMGMDYIAVYADDAAPATDGAGSVTIAPAMVQNMGVRTAEVQHSALDRRIDGVGYVAIDEDKIRREHVRVEGWVERLHVNFVGQQVRRGELLFELYAPRLVSASEEYVQALSVDNPVLQHAARERLVTLGLGPVQIKALTQTRQVPRLSAVYAPQDGVVQSLNVRPGVYVEPGMEVMALADLGSVWILVDVFGQQAAGVRPGAAAEARFDDLPGKPWHGRVDYLYPDINAATRTHKVRLRFDNPGLQLKPNMYASVHIKTGATLATLHMPSEALIRTGSGERVIVALGDGKFAQRAVVAGVEAGGRVEVIDGLAPGERVVISGQFLLDSEASLTAGLARLSPPDAAVPMAATKKTAQATGVVNAIDGDMINISHAPVPDINWPAMTMDFRRVDGAAVPLQPGTRIRFELREENGEFVVSNIAPLPGAAP